MSIAVTPQIKAYLEDLTQDGLHGCSPAEAARMVLSRAIGDMITSGALKKRNFLTQDGDVVTVPATQP